MPQHKKIGRSSIDEYDLPINLRKKRTGTITAQSTISNNINDKYKVAETVLKGSAVSINEENQIILAGQEIEIQALFIALEGGTEGDFISVARDGDIVTADYYDFDMDELVWLGDGEENVRQSEDFSGLIVQQLGMALNPNTILVTIEDKFIVD